jgi:hypothetical protein
LKKIVDHARSWLSPEWGWLAKQESHSAGKTSSGRKGTLKPQKGRKTLWKGQEFNDGLRKGLGQQPHSEIGIKDPDTRRRLHLRIKRTSDRIDGKTFRLEILKRAKEMSSRLQKVRKWTLWRGRPLQNAKRNCR